MLSAASLIGLFLWLDTRMAETLDPVRQLLTAIGGSTQ
jgi:hypothetical protein